MPKFIKDYKYAHGGHTVVEYKVGDECPADALATAAQDGVIEGAKRSTKAIKKPLENKKA